MTEVMNGPDGSHSIAFIILMCCDTPQWTTNGTGKNQCINFTTLQDGK